MRTALLLIAAGLVCAAAVRTVGLPKPVQGGRAAEPPFSIAISAKPNVFTVGSAMPIKVVLTNTSSHQISLLRLSWCNYTAEIRDSQGALVKAKPLAEKLPDGRFRLRHSGGSATRVQVDRGKVAWCICTVYNLTDDYEVTKPDKYSVQVLRYDDVDKVWVRSNTISIVVSPK